jgi:hypothetical protein
VTPEPPLLARDVIDRVLRRSMRRWFFRSLLDGLVVTAMMVSVFFVGIALLASTGVQTGLDARVPLLAGVFGVLIGIMRAWWLRPSSLHLARRIDALFELRDRLASAYEVVALHAGEEPESRVQRALLIDAALHAGRVDPRVVVPIHLRRAIVLTALPVILAVAMPLRTPEVPEQTATRPGALVPFVVPLEMTDEELLRVPETVRRLSLLMNAEATRREDSDIRALAEEFTRLSQQLDLGVSALEVRADLERVLTRAAGAFGLATALGVREGDGVGSDTDDALPGRTSAAPATRRPGETAPVDDGRGMEPLGRAAPPSPGQMLLDTLLERMEMDALAQAAPREGDNLDDVRFRQGAGDLGDGTYFDSPELRATTEQILENIRRQRDARAMEGGAAFDGAGRQGNEAGGAATPIDQGPRGRSLDDAIDGAAQVLLPTAVRSTGRRTELHPPSVGERRVPSGGAFVEDPAWIAFTEVQHAPEYVSTAHRAVVSAYFLPDRDQSGQGR